jgi:hypothetical protein
MQLELSQGSAAAGIAVIVHVGNPAGCMDELMSEPRMVCSHTTPV